ncbi:DedA family protein [Brevibacterium renqingii]|uniref:DedA family protein n=1 Tax=Brevibacterium renqingii TaxID=2776916 RepID=UPI001ADF3F40|nr:DedA family protein [Brevibacterium renqingii]
MSDDRADRDEAEPGPVDDGHAEDEPGHADAEPGHTDAKENPWSAIKPWRGKAAGLDKLLLFIIIGVPLVYLALMPLRPWMLVHAPVVQEFINGAKTSIVAAAAYARVGEIPLWLVIVAGFVGMAKLDWAFWLAGRRWGDGVLRLFAQNERQLKRINQLKRIPNWALFLMTLVSRCPGIPGTLVYLVAGWTRMRLSLFLIADLLGCLIFTLIWTVLGFQLGETAVDVLKVIDKYAMWLTLALIAGVFVLSFGKEYRKQRQAEAKKTSED